ncbi:glycosyltransferase [Sphingomonas profundi]|uniref:glycosyltransferase n=1 Tax=Alterirhizorhabdus profundi TaxID=2681549 RepID=UPI0012E7799B|nr:hypothetical protein [Sphingomonas profundi]
MKILYVSVHSVLEDDEIRMFKRLGHDVFPLGVNFGFQAVEPFRDPIPFNEGEHALLDRFHALGGRFRYGAPYAAETIVPAAFVELFDIVVVMHDLEMILRHWPALSVRPVVWRTIGQNIEGLEETASRLMGQGLNIVRYSPVERRAPGYCGETALIRFAKHEDDYGPWLGHSDHVLTFANLFRQRYPAEAEAYGQIVAGLPTMLGGVGNEGMDGAVGLLTPEQQKIHYDACRGYLYCSGREVPYTLNFMEALMTGMPVIACDFAPRGAYYEVPELLADGAGIVATNVAEARDAIVRLLEDRDFADETSRLGRARAVALFGQAHVSRQWDDLFTALAG